MGVKHTHHCIIFGLSFAIAALLRPVLAAAIIAIGGVLGNACCVTVSAVTFLSTPAVPDQISALIKII